MSASTDSYVILCVGELRFAVHERHYADLTAFGGELAALRAILCLQSAEGGEPIYVRADRIVAFYLSTPASRARFAAWNEADEEREPWQQ